MKIDKDKFYAIVCMCGGKVLKWFNNRVYEGRYVLNVYNKIKDKEHYKIYLIGNIWEVENESIC